MVECQFNKVYVYVQNCNILARMKFSDKFRDKNSQECLFIIRSVNVFCIL